MSNEIYLTDQGNVPQLSEENYPVWKQKICRVLIAKRAYNIVSSVKLLPGGNGIAVSPMEENWHDSANRAIAHIHLGCSDEYLPLINNIHNPVVICEALRDWLDNTATKLGCTQVLQMFTTSQPLPDEPVSQYFTILITFRKKVIGTTENITDNTMKTHIFITLSNLYETTFQIIEQQILARMAQ